MDCVCAAGSVYGLCRAPWEHARWRSCRSVQQCSCKINKCRACRNCSNKQCKPHLSALSATLPAAMNSTLLACGGRGRAVGRVKGWGRGQRQPRPRAAPFVCCSNDHVSMPGRSTRERSNHAASIKI